MSPLLQPGLVSIIIRTPIAGNVQGNVCNVWLLLLRQPEFGVALMASFRRSAREPPLRSSTSRQARGSTLPVARSRRQLFSEARALDDCWCGKTDLHQCLPFDSIVLGRHDESGFTRRGASALSLQLHRSRRYPGRFESGGWPPLGS
jgi:hypothetical protein